MYSEYGRNSNEKDPKKKKKKHDRETALMFLKKFKLINELIDELIFQYINRRSPFKFTF